MSSEESKTEELLRQISEALVNAADVLDVLESAELGSAFLPESRAEIRKWRDKCRSAHQNVPGVAARIAKLESALRNALDIIDGNKLAGWQNAIAAMRAALE
jgi:hypothetical protein